MSTITPDEASAPTVLEQLADELRWLLLAAESSAGDDLASFIVDRIGKLKIDIRAKEHPPPHFHVVCNEFNAKFAIETCCHLEGSLPRRSFRVIRGWYPDARPKLISEWNRTRPTNCPVGPIVTKASPD